MLKKVFLLGLIISFTSLFSQHTIKGKLTPVGKNSWVILYKLEGVNQKYVDNANFDNKKFTKEGEFTVTIPKGYPTGMYRLLYDNTNNKFIDFIYNNEDVVVEFHPDYPAQLVKYKKSKENKTYQSYIEKVSALQNKLDSLQVVYFQTNDKKEEVKLSKIYSDDLKELNTVQTTFEKQTKDQLANHFIKASNRFFSKNLIKDTNEYLNTIKSHYFDYVDFNSPVLLKSSLLIDRVMDYVFYLNTSKDSKILVKLRKEGIETALYKISKPELKKDVIESLLYTFAQQENIEMVDYLLKNHFTKLPVGLQDFEFKNLIKDMLKTTIGNKAPNLVWQEKGKEKSLYNLNLKEKKYYLVVFWSSTCTHCLKEMPVLQKYLEDKPEVQVIAIGLETEISKIGWVDEKFYYEDFIHILGENKYENKYVKDYGVNSTPNFFLLNSDKIIISKPYDVKELKKVYAALQKEAKKEKIKKTSEKK
jgi:thiol-disulfide isomerase/thioredoxin